MIIVIMIFHGSLGAQFRSGEVINLPGSNKIRELKIRTLLSHGYQ